MKRPRRSTWEEGLFVASTPKVIALEAAQEIRPAQKPIGRPRVNPPGERYATWPLKTSSGLPMVCRRRGCNRRLRKNDVLVCSPYCRDELKYFSESVLNVFSGAERPEDFPMHFRSARMSVWKKRKRG